MLFCALKIICQYSATRGECCKFSSNENTNIQHHHFNDDPKASLLCHQDENYPSSSRVACENIEHNFFLAFYRYFLLKTILFETLTNIKI